MQFYLPKFLYDPWAMEVREGERGGPYFVLGCLSVAAISPPLPVCSQDSGGSIAFLSFIRSLHFACGAQSSRTVIFAQFGF